MEGLTPYYVALAAAITVSTSGQILLKMGSVRTGDVTAQFLNPFTIVGLGTYGIAAILYIIAIKKIPISIAYPSVSASYAVVAILAYYLWGERLGWNQIGGILLIWTGIALLHRA